MQYKTLQALADPTFADVSKWTNEADSGFNLAGDGVTHTVANPPVHEDHAGPQLYQALATMVDPITFGIKAKVVVVVDTMDAGADMHVHLIKLLSGVVAYTANIILQKDGAGSFLASITTAGTYVGEFVVPAEVQADGYWVIGLYGNTGTADTVTVISSMSVYNQGDAITCEITSSEPDPTSESSFECTVTFGESVTGFAVGDITVTNGTASNFSGSDATYTFDVTPTGDNPSVVYVDIAAGVAASPTTGLPNAAAAQFQRTYYVAGGAGEALTTTFEQIVE